MRHGTVQASIVEMPFFDPKKKIVAAWVLYISSHQPTRGRN
jgi:hypothetical protein